MAKEFFPCNTCPHFLLFFLKRKSHLPNYQGNDFNQLERSPENTLSLLLKVNIYRAVITHPQ